MMKRSFRARGVGVAEAAQWEMLETRTLLSSALPGAEFQVNSFTSGTQFSASVAVEPTGNFVVAWAAEGQDGSGYGERERVL
jgi:hypothetical protein